MRTLAAVLVATAALAAGTLPTPVHAAGMVPGIEPYLGTWRGDSHCEGVRPACHEEDVVYRFVRVPGGQGQARLYADKIVNGRRDPMGVLTVTRDPASGAVAAEFRIRQTHGVWRYALGRAAGELRGTLTLLPDGALGRTVRAHRAADATLPPAPAFADYGDDPTVAPSADTAPAPAMPTTEAPAAVAAPWTFEADIAAFEAADRAAPPAPGGVVFIGSSSIRMWPDVAADFPGTRAVNRGFGGSTMADAVRAAPRILVPRQPRIAVLYAGDNDLNAGTSPQQVLADYRAFAALVHHDSPKTRIVVVSIKPSPSRWGLVEQMRATNALLRAEVARDPRARFVDVFTPMLGADGKPRPALYGPDQLHMTPAGYALWRARVAPALK